MDQKKKEKETVLIGWLIPNFVIDHHSCVSKIVFFYRSMSIIIRNVGIGMFNFRYVKSNGPQSTPTEEKDCPRKK